MAAVPSWNRLADEVEFRAFRGARRSAVYRSHVIEAPTLARIVQAAPEARLRLLAQLRVDRPVELEPDAARELGSELGRLRAQALLVDLDTDLVALAEVANWCGRSRERAWLRIGPR